MVHDFLIKMHELTPLHFFSVKMVFCNTETMWTLSLTGRTWILGLHPHKIKLLTKILGCIVFPFEKIKIDDRLLLISVCVI